MKDICDPGELYEEEAKASVKVEQSGAQTARCYCKAAVGEICVCRGNKDWRSQLAAARERIKELEQERKQCSELNNCDLPSLYENAEQEAARLREALGIWQKRAVKWCAASYISRDEIILADMDSRKALRETE